MNRYYLFFICLVSALGGLLFGYDWVVIGGAKPFYELFFNIESSQSLQGLAMAIALIGCMIGAMVCGALADKMGRKWLLVVSSLLFLASSFGTGSAKTFSIFLLFRFFCGIGIGLASGLSPMYIAEVAQSNIRGRLVSLNQMAIVIGILSAQVVNWHIAQPIPDGYTAADILHSWNGQIAWRWMFWAAAFPAGIFMILSLFIPESPRWLIMKGRENAASGILKRIGGSDYASQELNSVKNTMDASNDKHHISLGQVFKKPYQKIILLGIFIAVFQQWSGTNVIFNYAQEVFQSAGFTINNMFLNIVVTGIANVVSTIIAILVVDRLGRRLLMLIGAIGLCVLYLLLGVCYFYHVSGIFMIILVVSAISCYALTLGPCTWVLISELFPNKMRALGVSVCTFSLWVGSTTLTYTFPLLNASLGSWGTFWIYSLICGISFIVLYHKLPETKDKSLEEIEEKLIGKVVQ